MMYKRKHYHIGLDRELNEIMNLKHLAQYSKIIDKKQDGGGVGD